MRAWTALMRIDLKLALRNKSVLFFNYFFPLVFFFIFGQLAGTGQGNETTRIVAMVIALGILGNGLFGAGMRAVQERETNVLRRYKVTPITPVPLLAASMTTGVILYLPSAIITLILATRMYHMAFPPNILSLFLFVCVASVAFRSIGLIIASVVNSAQESILLIQPLYIGMLFLSGITIPTSIFPAWLQVAVQFLPATYLMSGMQGILQMGDSIWKNWLAVIALILTAVVGTFISSKLFRWEKEEKLKSSAKLWVLAALAPFVLLGVYQSWSKEDVRKSKILSRDLHRGHSYLIQNARIIVGNGRVIESGAVLIKNGKIGMVYEGTSPEAKSLDAEALDAAGKTVLPGLIDVNVHLGSPGGVYANPAKADQNRNEQHEIEGYLYSGVTAVRDIGDPVERAIRLRELFNSGEMLGAELFVAAPAPQADQKVDSLVLTPVSTEILRKTIAAAHQNNIPVSIQTGSGQDVTSAISTGPDSIEHGSYDELISDADFSEMKAKGVAFDPTLSAVEASIAFSQGDSSLLGRSLVQQVNKDLIASTAKLVKLGHKTGEPMSLDIAKQNLVRAWKAGVMLVTGSGAGVNLVMHGPTVEHEIEIWTAAGIPPEAAIQAATGNAAKLLRAANRTGTIEPGKDATLVVTDGNPLQDIKALSSISVILMKGERIDRGDLFDQK